MVQMDLVKNSVYVALFLEVLIVNGGTKVPKTIYSPGMDLLQAERNFLKLLNEYKTNMESNVKKIGKYIEHFTSLYDSDETDYEEFLSDPINTYLLQRRLTLDVDDIVKERLWEPTKKLMDTVKSLRSTGQLAHRDNISNAVEHLYNLQGTYGLDSKALYEGYIKCSNYSNCPSKKYAEKLTSMDKLSFVALDAVFMTIKAVGSLDFDRVTEWTELAAKKQPHDDLLMAKDGVIDQSVEAIDKIVGMVKMSMAMSITTGNGKLPNLKNETIERLQRLCRGEKLQSLSEEKDLKCFHLDVDDPYYMMQPIRAEQLSEEPFITMLHDIINHAEAETLKLLAKTNVAKTSKAGSKNIKNNLSSLRKSINTLIPSNINEVTVQLDHKIQDMLDVELNKDDEIQNMYQVYGYGTSGSDVKIQELPPKSSRVKLSKLSETRGTLLLFLSDVKFGGATIFPTIGVTIQPKKGSGILWSNTIPLENNEKLPFHYDCPLLRGTKWVASRMI